MNLTKLKKIFADNGCQRIYVKSLAPNDNSKNQVYLGGSFQVLNTFPISEIIADNSGDWSKERFKASIRFSWLSNSGEIWPAPGSQFILYPKYPEVRFSGFLAGCNNGPSTLMASRIPGRLLFLSVAFDGTALGYVTDPTSEIAKEFSQLAVLETMGVFSVIPIAEEGDSRQRLIAELRRIHDSGWIQAKRLDRTRSILPCNSPNCGGYTLEAELGITPNGYSQPDFLGYEIKQFKTTRFDTISNEPITLMTPEPTGGEYKESGIEHFIRKYGYPDRNGKEDRANFGGIHKNGTVHPVTGLRLEILGFDQETGKIRNAAGSIALIDSNDSIAASWSFVSLIKHWNEKHNLACYVPAKAITSPVRQYYYGNNVLLASGADFQLFLRQLHSGNVYYDPGIKMENMSSPKPTIKRRSQFRIKTTNLTGLYHRTETINLLATQGL